MGIMIAAVLIALAVPVLLSMSVFQEGAQQLGNRFEEASVVENGTQGFVGREVNTMVGPLGTIDQVPFFGYGLGLGTNAGWTLFHSDRDLVWPEEEWTRLIFESGPVFGLLLCLFRIILTVAVAKRALDAFRHGNILPVLIFAACGLLILNGQWGVPTTLGFAIFGAGLTLAACVEPSEWEEEDEEQADDQTDDQAEGESDHSQAADTIG